MIVATLIFLPILAGVLSVYLYRRAVPRSVWILSFGAFAARVGYVLFDRMVGIYAGGGDQSGYDTTFWFIAQQWQSGVLLAPLQFGASPGNDGYYMVVYSTVFSPTYAVFGRIVTLPRLQMALVGTLVVVNVYCIGRVLADHRTGFAAGAITTVFPYWIVLSGIIYRDMFAVFLFSMMAYYLVRWQSGERTTKILMLVLIFTGLSLSMRLENLIAIGAMFAIAVLLFVGTDFRGYVVAALTGAIAVTGMYYQLGSQRIIDRLAGQRQWLARPNPGAYLPAFAYESLYELFVFAPIGALHFALVPFPWHVIDLLSTIAFLQNLFLWYPIVVLAIIGFRDSLSVSSGIKMSLPLAAFGLAGIFGYGIVEGNVGPAMRHRSQFQFVFFVFAGVALSKRVKFQYFKL